MFKVTEKDILNVYKEEGKIREYNMSMDYLKLMTNKSKKITKENSKDFCVRYNILLKWQKSISSPYGIKCISFLKERSLLPYQPNERTARIVGFLHGDGFLFNSLTNFGFVSKDKDMLLKIKKDVEEEFKVTGELKKKRDKGDIEYINNKKILIKQPTYELRCPNRALGSLLLKLGVPKGKKIYQEMFVPDWVLSGNKNIKRAFLQGLFDSELSNSSISTYKGHKNNLSSPRMEMGKSIDLKYNLYRYLEQIKNLLTDFGINSTINYLRKYNHGKISFTLIVNNKLINIYYLIDKVGFYYNFSRAKKAEYIKRLAAEKIKKKNVLYKILDYCKDKSYFTTENIEKDLKISPSSSRLWGSYLEKYGFATRERMANKWFKYFPNLDKIENIIKNPLLLERLPKLGC